MKCCCCHCPADDAHVRVGRWTLAFGAVRYRSVRAWLRSWKFWRRYDERKHWHDGVSRWSALESTSWTAHAWLFWIRLERALTDDERRASLKNLGPVKA